MKYKFTPDIRNLLNPFIKYLESKHLAKDTVRPMKNYAGIYLQWLKEEGVEVEDVDYKTFTAFIFQLKKERSLKSTRRIILAVRHYYDYLSIGINPASGIYIRGHRSSIVNDLVPYQWLLDLYDNYDAFTDRQKRNKVIIGLCIHQAISTGGLLRLEPSHIKLKEGKIYVPGYGKVNSRILDLAAVQLLDLKEYLDVIRPRMLENLSIDRPGRKVAQIDPLVYDRLFFSESGSANIKDSLYNLFRSIKKECPSIKSGKVIRSTVIVEWLKTKDLRIVQYMAGHRYVSSTERYNVANLKALKEKMGKYHPLR